MLRRMFQDLLRRIGAYDRMRETFAYDCYRRLKHGYPIGWRNSEYLMYRSLLGAVTGELLIFDVGANRGQRTEVFLRLGAKVVAVEPDATNQRVLARRYSQRGRPVTVIGKAVSDSAAGATLWVHRPGSGLNSLSRKWVEGLGNDASRFGSTVQFASTKEVETTTLEELMEAYGTPVYIKIDVEGHELSVLQGLKRSVPYLSFEVSLPEMLDESLECVAILARLSEKGTFNWFVDFQPSFSLAEWLPPSAFGEALRDCRESTVEVFWRSAS
jgi:FkbM family methyltransferase